MIKQLLVFTTLFVLGACAILPGAKSADPGILQGTVTVGPLQPVEQVGVPTPTVPPEVYTSRGINIYRQDGKTLVKALHFNPDGTYHVELPPGQYVVKLLSSGIEHAKELPAAIMIKSGETMKLDIAVDTGIR